MNGAHESQHELHAYVDRELDPARALAIETELARDAELAARAHDIRTQKSALHAVFDVVLAEPLPRRWSIWLSQRFRVRVRGRSARQRASKPGP